MSSTVMGPPDRIPVGYWVSSSLLHHESILDGLTRAMTLLQTPDRQNGPSGTDLEQQIRHRTPNYHTNVDAYSLDGGVR